jgi:hypothetical protein
VTLAIAGVVAVDDELVAAGVEAPVGDAAVAPAVRPWLAGST